MASAPEPDDGEQEAAWIERRWAALSVLVVCLLIVMAVFAGIHEVLMPQARVETVNFRTLHLAGEFIESNLGTALEPDDTVMVRAVAQQYSFSPPCILVPAGVPVTFRATSADVVHGFIIDGTNVNTMLVPGFISVIKTTFVAPGDHHMPCHEFCGVGHEGMWARVRVIDPQSFHRMAANKERLSCAD